MVKVSTQYTCQKCGNIHSKWVGQCDGCGSWNSVSENHTIKSVSHGLKAGAGKGINFEALHGETRQKKRWKSDITEFDRACGGGIVPGCAILVGGDPGIGKSTLLLQVAGALATKTRCIYISGEESTEQVRLRALRLKLTDARVAIASETSVQSLVTTFDNDNKTGIVIVDSIQTMYVDTIDAAPGTVSQVRASAQELINLAKKRGFSLVLVGHVTKEGNIAGPRILEHMVDTVLYFEGDRGHQFRILRTRKNRFGPTDEIGVFEMTGHGLSEVKNPSTLFLSQRQTNLSGTSVFAGMEGSRPVLVEIQALIASTTQATPRRAVVGWDNSRLAMILAVLDTRCGISLANHEVYLNVAGGLRINEPAADLAVATALISAVIDCPTPSDSVIFGEIGLSGEIRPVGQSDLRIKEAAKLGFKKSIYPESLKRNTKLIEKNFISQNVNHLKDLIEIFPEGVFKSLTNKGHKDGSN